VIAGLAARAGTGVVIVAVAAGSFGVSHLVAARAGYAGCPELGAIASVALGRDVRIGCVPWRMLDHQLGLALDAGTAGVRVEFGANGSIHDEPGKC